MSISVALRDYGDDDDDDDGGGSVVIDWCHVWSRHDESYVSLFQDDAKILQRMMRSMKR